MENESRKDIRRILKTFGIKADEAMVAHLARNPEIGELKIRIVLEDLTDYGDKFKPEFNQGRDGIHEIWEGHKGLAQEKKALVVSPVPYPLRQISPAFRKPHHSRGQFLSFLAEHSKYLGLSEEHRILSTLPREH